MEESLNKLVNLASKKQTIPIKIETYTTETTIQFEEDIVLKDESDFKIGVIWCDFTNAIHNVTTVNNNFRYYNGTTWKDVVIPAGAYELDQLNIKIKEIITNNGDNSDNITIGVDVSTFKSTVTLANNYEVDFSIANNIGSLLGFNSAIINTQGKTYSNNNVHITSYETINITCSLVNDFYFNNKKTNLIFSSPITVPQGYTARLMPVNITWLPVRAKRFNQITFRVVDDNFQLINFQGYPIRFLIMLTQI